MSSDQYQREIAQLVKEAGTLCEAIGKEEDVAGVPHGLRLIRPEGEEA